MHKLPLFGQRSVFRLSVLHPKLPPYWFNSFLFFRRA